MILFVPCTVEFYGKTKEGRHQLQSDGSMHNFNGKQAVFLFVHGDEFLDNGTTLLTRSS